MGSLGGKPEMATIAWECPFEAVKGSRGLPPLDSRYHQNPLAHKTLTAKPTDSASSEAGKEKQGLVVVLLPPLLLS